LVLKEIEPNKEVQGEGPKDKEKTTFGIETAGRSIANASDGCLHEYDVDLNPGVSRNTYGTVVCAW
jgi:hypothetical protein